MAVMDHLIRRDDPAMRKPGPVGSRATLVSRWLELTRRQLPGMAADHGWPIRLDHCFMRVCLDASFGRPWHEVVARPAIRHAADADLARAVAVAEAIVRDPSTLPALNAASLRMRGKCRPASQTK